MWERALTMFTMTKEQDKVDDISGWELWSGYFMDKRWAEVYGWDWCRVMMVCWFGIDHFQYYNIASTRVLQRVLYNQLDRRPELHG